MNNTANNEETPSDTLQVDQSLNGIRGWLILPAIGLVIGSILGLVALIFTLGMYKDTSEAGYGGFFTFVLLAQAGLLGFTIFVAIQFFNKKRNTPKLIITLYGMSLLSLMILTVFSPIEEVSTEFGTSLVREAISAAIWIPYFMNSKRVKATFIND